MSKKNWKLEELAEKSRHFLDREGESNRIQWTPNGRQIRYYTTLGLLDKPFGGRGQGASYGPKHLLQLIAIKRLQHQGLKLAEIQPVLTGSSTEKLTELLGFSQTWLAELQEQSQADTEDSERQQSEFWSVIPDIPRQEVPVHDYSHFEIAPGATLVASKHALDHLQAEEIQLLAEELRAVWQKHQP